MQRRDLGQWFGPQPFMSRPHDCEKRENLGQSQFVDVPDVLQLRAKFVGRVD